MCDGLNHGKLSQNPSDALVYYNMSIITSGLYHVIILSTGGFSKFCPWRGAVAGSTAPACAVCLRMRRPPSLWTKRSRGSSGSRRRRREERLKSCCWVSTATLHLSSNTWWHKIKARRHEEESYGQLRNAIKGCGTTPWITLCSASNCSACLAAARKEAETMQGMCHFESMWRMI